MIAGLPWTTWALLAAAVAPGVGLAVAFQRAHRADRNPLGADDEREGVDSRSGDNDPADR